MEEISPEIPPQTVRSSDNEYSLSPVNTSDDQQCRKEEDDRIVCSNSRSLDLMLKVVSSNVERFADSEILGEEKSNFVSRVLEIFNDNIQENATVNGLPYVVNKKCLSPIKTEVQNNETKEALLSNLSKKVEEVAAKRKHIPKECLKFYSRRLHLERQSLKKASVSSNVSLPSVSRKDFKVDTLSSQKIQKIGEQLNSSQAKILDTVNELKEIQKNIKYAQSVVTKEKSLYDAGYNSF